MQQKEVRVKNYVMTLMFFDDWTHNNPDLLKKLQDT
jgi:hypothetical protein